MKCTERLLQHAAQYRRDGLGIDEAGTFNYRGAEIRVEHVLPKEEIRLGIPPETREEVRAFCTNNDIKLHR